ncbi:MAG: alpha/beta hydrolase-fold protein [Bacteroidota bacterium]
MQPNYQPIIRIIEEDYEMPQLGRRRRISALLPHDYETSEKYYPVLYLHDGQNLFDENAPYGNWAIDKSLTQLRKEGHGEVIIIAIDHGEKDRISEYSPFPSERFGAGQGILYLRFLLETLKPYVDRTFRVLSDGANTGIGGSSMGGLFSLFAGLRRPDVFSKMMIFSPSLWIAPRIYKMAQRFQPVGQSLMYLYSGEKESPTHHTNIEVFIAYLKMNNLSEDQFKKQLVINPQGTHSEYYWSREFPVALKWLFNQ